MKLWSLNHKLHEQSQTDFVEIFLDWLSQNCEGAHAFLLFTRRQQLSLLVQNNIWLANNKLVLLQNKPRQRENMIKKRWWSTQNLSAFLKVFANNFLMPLTLTVYIIFWKENLSLGYFKIAVFLLLVVIYLSCEEANPFFVIHF